MSLIKSYRLLKSYRQDPLGFITRLHQEHGHRIHLKIFGRELFIVSHPKDVLHVLKLNHASYTKGRTTKALKQFLGSGLITEEGDKWRRQHRLIRPMMNPKSIMELAPKILATATEFIPEIDTNKDVNAFRELNRLTWRIILKTLFSQEPTAAMDKWLDDILDLMHIITAKTRSSIPVPFWVPTSNHRRMRKIIKIFDEYVFGLISDRRKGAKKDDLVQLLIDAQEEGVANMTDREIRDEVMTFMMAGHETITNAMTWVLMEIARNPQYVPHLEAEAKVFFETKNFEDLSTMPWLGAVIDESMRLWPPVWVFMRQAEVPDQIGEMKIPPKANVVLAPYLTHRSSDFWEEPEKFYPERFFATEKKKMEAGVYYPYGFGPRACIGAYFAGMEAKIILATLVHHFQWSLVKPEAQTFDPGITLRATNNLMMNFRRKS